MILKDTTSIDTRVEVKRPGPYLDGMAVHLCYYLGTEDEWAGEPNLGESVTRFGRRLLCQDSRGFLWTQRYPTAESAHEALLEMFPDPEQDDCPEHGPQEVTGHDTTPGPDPYDISLLACGHRVICMGPGEPNTIL